MTLRAKIIQIVTIIVAEALALALVAAWLPGFQIHSWLSAALMGIVFILIQTVFWWVFINLFSWLPVWLYPILTFVLSGGVILVGSRFVQGVSIDGLGTAIWIAFWLAVVNAILAAFLSLDLDASFDRNVTHKLIKRRGKPIKTDVPGFVFLEIDGLSEQLFRRALAEGHLPTLKSWLDRGSHSILGWETDFSSQTGAMQTGILMGNNDDIPAYRWWDRDKGRVVISGDPRDTVVLERQLSDGHGLLADGGASRGNMFSGDAGESLFTFSTLLDRHRGRGPGFYAYLINPFIVGRLLTNYFKEVCLEWWQAWQQRRRKDKYIVSARNFFYAFYRASMGALLQDLATYTVISDILRGVPAVYALYAGYDDLAHYAGTYTPEAVELLTKTDQLFARVEKALPLAPRPYHLIVLSDHGQSQGPTFKAAHGLSLETLVKGLVKGEEKVVALAETHEAWDNINAILSESVNANTRTARVLRRMLDSKIQGDLVTLNHDPNLDQIQQPVQNDGVKIIIAASGCTGLINFSDAKERLTYEAIQARYPDLILGLVNHPGIGFVLVYSAENGHMVLGKKGIYFLDSNTFEGENPLAHYLPTAAVHLKRESGFHNCPDLLVNTHYDPETGELCGFENQVGHHGGLGGLQNHPFVLHPISLPGADQPIVGAMHLHHLLHRWRIAAQGEPAAHPVPPAVPVEELF